MQSNNRTFELGPNDCCIILREDCSVENLVPQMPEDEPVPNNILLITAAACCLLNQEMSQQMIDFMLEAIQKLDLDTDSPKNLESTPKSS